MGEIAYYAGRAVYKRAEVGTLPVQAGIDTAVCSGPLAEVRGEHHLLSGAVAYIYAVAQYGAIVERASKGAGVGVTADIAAVDTLRDDYDISLELGTRLHDGVQATYYYNHHPGDHKACRQASGCNSSTYGSYGADHHTYATDALEHDLLSMLHLLDIFHTLISHLIDGIVKSFIVAGL